MNNANNAKNALIIPPELDNILAVAGWTLNHNRTQIYRRRGNLMLTVYSSEVENGWMWRLELEDLTQHTYRPVGRSQTPTNLPTKAVEEANAYLTEYRPEG